MRRQGYSSSMCFTQHAELNKLKRNGSFAYLSRVGRQQVPFFFFLPSDSLFMNIKQRKQEVIQVPVKSVCQINVSNSTFSYFFEVRGFLETMLHANISYQGIFCNIFLLRKQQEVYQRFSYQCSYFTLTLGRQPLYRVNCTRSRPTTELNNVNNEIGCFPAQRRLGEVNLCMVENPANGG